MFFLSLFSANMERSNLYLKLFKLVFGSVSLFASENEQMLKVRWMPHEYVHRAVMRGKGGSRILKWGVNFCNNVREIKYCFNIWGIRNKKKKKGR